MKTALYRFKKLNPIKVAVGASVALLGFAGNANAVTLKLDSVHKLDAEHEGKKIYEHLLFENSRDYLLIGNGGANDVGNQPGVGDAVDVQNFELGANKAGTPSVSGDFEDNPGFNASTLLNNVPDIPLEAQAVESGIGGKGNIAITSTDGTVSLSNVGLYADLGIRCTQSEGNCNGDSISNSFWNDPNNYPNNFSDIETPSNYKGDIKTNNVYGTGEETNGHQDHNINENKDDPNSSGVDYLGIEGNYNFSALKEEIFTGNKKIMDLLNSLGSTGTLTTEDGYIKPDDDDKYNPRFRGNSSLGSFTETTATKKGGTEFAKDEGHGTLNLSFGAGLHIIDIKAKGSNGNDKDFVLENINFIVDSLTEDKNDTFVIFRLDENMLISNSNVLAGNNMGLNNVLFVSDKADNDEHFNISNSVINGAAFWTTAERGGEINVNNSQGCTQLVADKINLNDVRYNRCAFTTELYKKFNAKPPRARVPEPGSVIALAFIGGGIFLTRRRQSK